MKMVHPDLQYHIILEENYPQIMVVENQQLFYKYIDDIRRQCVMGEAGEFVLSEEDTILSFDKNADIVINPFDLDINNKRILTKLYGMLKEQSHGEELYLDTSQVMSCIETYVNRIAETTKYPLEYAMDIDITGLYKLLGLRFVEEGETLLERLIDYMLVMQEFCSVKMFFLVNMRSFLTDDDCKKLYHEVEYMKIKLIFLENCVPSNISKNEKIYIIDESGCEIY